MPESANHHHHQTPHEDPKHENPLTPSHVHIASADLPPQEPKKRIFGGKKWIGIFLGITFTLGAGMYGITHTTPSEVEGKSTSLFSSLHHLVGSSSRSADAAADDRITILLLGIGGAGHAGGQLTDTMMLASFQPSTGNVGMISIPRDLTLPIDGHGYGKINAVHAYAEQDDTGSGMDAISSVLEDIFSTTIDYTVKVDFSSFEELIDAIGGVRVYVTRSFTDPEYPIDGMEDAECPPSEDPSAYPYACRYEALSFTQGWTTMNGATALKYARSRHGNNGEGSDFARAARQQNIMLAVREQLLSLGVLLNPKKLQNIATVIDKNVSTTLSFWEMVDLAQYIDDINTTSMATHVIDGSSGLVYNSTLNGAYVLLPKHEDWRDFKSLAEHIFTATTPSSGSAQESPSGSQIPTTQAISLATVAVENGTPTAGLAAQTAQLLESSGYRVTSVGNAKETSWEQTTIIDFSEGKKSEALAQLQAYLRADVIMSSSGALAAKHVIPQVIWSTKDISAYRADSTTDFLIILGSNTENFVRSSSSYAY